MAYYGRISTTLTMKTVKKLTITALSAAFLVAGLAGLNAGAKDAPKPDKLTTCPVSGDKLGEMGKPFTFEYKGQEVKLCCKSCKKDFDKEPDKYMAKIRAADSASADKSAKN